MLLKKLKIEGYRRIRNAEILFADATFLIGENNVGKSAVLQALELLHSGTTKLEPHDFFCDELSDFNAQEVILTAEYAELPIESEKWMGFGGRVLKRSNKEGGDERYILFRKIFTVEGKFSYSLKEYLRELKPEFIGLKKVSQFIKAGILKQDIINVFGEIEDEENITLKKYQSEFYDLLPIWNFDVKNESWFDNPGGFQGNILIKLPRFLLIPAEDRITDIDGKTGALQKVMDSLFQDVRDASENFTKAQEYLDKLAKELDPEDNEKEFGKMLGEINSIVGNVFPKTGLHVETKLSDADKVLKPHFNIEMSSNIKTLPSRQGTGSVRSAAFALLRYREHFLEKKRILEKKGNKIRPLLIGFEEPEIYLHPNAANNMRDEIYALAISSNSQIVCTTHSPYMIDLGKDLDLPDTPRQVLNLLKLDKFEDDCYESTLITAFNTTEAYKKLITDEKDRVKFVLKLDDYVARIFFVRNIIIVEGDTEDIVLKETIKRMPDRERKIIQSDFQIIKARGKATIIALVKYLISMGLTPFVIHDKDEIEGATKYNKPILDALGSEDYRIMLDNCIEDVLGYKAPSSNKPFIAFEYIQKNWLDSKWENVGIKWKEIVTKKVFPQVFK